MIKKLLAVILCAGLVLAGMAGCSNVSDLVSGGRRVPCNDK